MEKKYNNYKKKEVESFGDRKEAETKEALDEKVTKAPKQRFQVKQQVQDTMDASSEKPGKEQKFEIETVTVPAQRFKTTEVATIKKEVPKGVSAQSSGNGALGLTVAPSYSGNSGSIAADMSGSASMGRSDRSDSRTGKKLDATSKKLDYFISEQITLAYDESKSLSENPSEVQGYNGTYRNEHARTQKVNGGVPGELYFDRSVDEIHTDIIYPVMGQYVEPINQPLNETPTKNYIGEGAEDADDDGYTAYSNPRGNYLHGSLKLTFNGTDMTNFSFDNVADISARDANSDVVNMSSQAAIIDANTAEIDRQNMDAKAGDERQKDWCPLARTTVQPTAIIGMLRDYEASTGAEVYMAYKKTAACMSYQNNKVAKDGQRVTSPMGEMLNGVTTNAEDYSVLKSLKDEDFSVADTFSSANYATASAALMIGLYDSVLKYTTKGKVLTLPQSIRLHLQTADNNMNVLRVPKNFAKDVQATECFSTIGGEYDPFLPTLITDKASLAHPYNFNNFKTKINGTVNENIYSYVYKNNTNNKYVVDVKHPLIEGLYDLVTSLKSKFIRALGATDAKPVTINIPCVHSTTSFSLWSLLILAATPRILKARISSFIDVLDYESAFEYPFSQLVDMSTANPMYAENYINSDYSEPLVSKKLDAAKALRYVLPETFWLQDENSNDWRIVLPYYFNEKQFTVSDEGLILSDRPNSMSYFSVRSGTKALGLDDLYSMSERDFRLCLNRMTVPPMFETVIGDKLERVASPTFSTMEVYKYGLSSDGIPALTYAQDALTVVELLKTPRELGTSFICPNGVLTPIIKAYTSEDAFTTGKVAMTDSIIKYGLSPFRIRCWRTDDSKITGSNVLGVANSPLSIEGINVSRGASLRQGWYMIIAQRAVTNLDYDFGFLPGIQQMFTPSSDGGAVILGKSLFTPFTSASGVPLITDSYKTISLQKALWFRNQRFPMLINPFDAISSSLTALAEDGSKVDPYDYLYYNGLAGMRASDYNEDIYNRNKERLNQGMMYLEDPFLRDSIIYHA